MNVFVAIIGLAFLILIHEAGHFFAAIWVGMRPRRFYVGFPPALAKTTRNGIEYGIGVVPLGGYVKIPGMHRPAPSDADVHFGRALQERPELAAPLQRLKRALAAGDDAAADAALEELDAPRRRPSAGRLLHADPGDHGRPLAAGLLAAGHVAPDRRHPGRPGNQLLPRRRPLRRPLHGRRRQGDQHGRASPGRRRRPPRSG